MIILPHHLKTLDELVGVWRVDHGRPPTSVFEPISGYGAVAWPLSDPWGKPWSFDANSGMVTADQTIGRAD
jgi:hypothetical protein